MKMKKVTELSKHLSPTKKVEKGDKDKNNKVKDIKKHLSPTICAICHVKESEILCDFVTGYNNFIFDIPINSQHKHQTCSLPMCKDCRVKHGLADLCPWHDNILKEINNKYPKDLKKRADEYQNYLLEEQLKNNSTQIENDIQNKARSKADDNIQYRVLTSPKIAGYQGKWQSKDKAISTLHKYEEALIKNQEFGMYEIHLILQKKEKSTNDTSIERDLRLMLERNDKTGIVNRYFKVVYDNGERVD